MVTFKINGRAVQAPAGSYILESIRELGLDIPALCDHPSLEPYGACRLCIVEVTHPEWQGYTRIVTSCDYPVREGLEVSTNAPRVLETRRELLDMLLARCPESSVVRDVARRYAGLDKATIEPVSEPSDCILCGLCVRVCEDLSTGVLGHRNRGADREVSPPEPAEDCVGCGACALVCPTGCIEFIREKGRWSIWDQDFSIPYCTVNSELCRACGLCEEACNFDVAQVKLFVGGTSTSSIEKDYCQGCGSCIAACPTAAIQQEIYSEAELLERILELATAEPHVVIVTCPRSPLPDDLREKVIELPCIGRASLPMLMAALLAGAQKVLLICRDPGSCYFGAGEAQARGRAELAQSLAGLMRFGEDRFEVRHPDAGHEGPAELVRSALAASYDVNPLGDKTGYAIEEGGFDLLARQLVALCESGVTPDLTTWKAGLPVAADAETLIYVHRISIFDHLAAAITGHHHVRELMAQALNALQELGVPADVVSGRAGCHGSDAAIAGDALAIKETGAKRVLCVCPDVVEYLAPHLPGVEVVWLDTYLSQRAAKMEPMPVLRVAVPAGYDVPSIPGVEWVEYSVNREAYRGKFSFTQSHDALSALQQRIIGADALPGVTHFLGECPGDFLQMSLLQREGAWRLGCAEPVTLAELACRAILGGGNG